MPVAIFGVIALCGMFVLNNTRFGRRLYAIGGNEDAARLSGINVFQTKLIVYATISVLAALSGILLASRLNGASPNLGEMFELDAIAAVVIGGTSLSGGSGHDRWHGDRCADHRRAEQRHEPLGRLDLLPADHQGPDHHLGGVVRRSAEEEVSRGRASDDLDLGHDRLRAVRAPATAAGVRWPARRGPCDAATHFLGSAGIATAVGALALTTCTGLPRDAADKVKIGFLLKTMQEERYQTDKALFISRAEIAGRRGAVLFRQQ